MNTYYNSETLSSKEKELALHLHMLERKSRIVYLNDPIDKDTAYKINRMLVLLDEENQNPIKLFINSPGGEVNSGFFIFDCIKFIRSPVYIIGAGLVASAAALIYLAVDKEYRISLPHARFMLHQPLSGMKGVVTDIEIHAKEVEELKQLINTIIAEATDNPLKKVEKDTDRDFWLNAQEAKKYGLVNTIITHKDEMDFLFPVSHTKSSDTSAKKSSKKTSASTRKNATSNTTKTSSKNTATKKTNTKKTSSASSTTKTSPKKKKS